MATAKNIGSITVPHGFSAAGATCGIKPSGLRDLALIVSDRPCSVAGVLTRSRVPGAAITVTRNHLRRGTARAIVCNSGIANVATGAAGIRDAKRMCSQVGRLLHCPTHQVLPCSTGLIGPRLPLDKIVRGIDAVAAKRKRGPRADDAAARAIMTTDLVPKSAHRRFRCGPAASPLVCLGGIAKGSGMIAPQMATMLAFITTDVSIGPPALRAAVKTAADLTFNRISIDSDTSTSDAVLVLANGAASGPVIARRSRAYATFVDALVDLCDDLSRQIVRDGEGATRTIMVLVERAASDRDADRVGRSITESPLIKTAVHGADPNWGRLVMAVGKSGARVDPARLTLSIANVVLFRRGAAVPLKAPTRRKLTGLMRRHEVVITVDLGLGRASCRWLGCDLSRDYVKINAKYTT